MHISTDLDPASLIAAAKEQTGLEDFLGAEFLPLLEHLCQSINTEAQLHEIGGLTQAHRLTEIIATRMQVEDYYRRFPEIADEVIEPPVVIVGLPRTGSTLLQRLIAHDQQFLSLKYWESRFPAPFAEEQLTHPVQRIKAAKEEVEMMIERVPELIAIHPLDAMAADEEISLLEQSLYSSSSEAFMNVPSFSQYLAQQDHSIGYQYLSKLLKFLQWQKRQRGESGTRWILKSPHHLHGLAVLVANFPGLKIIHTHRDPIQTIPSIASFNTALWRLNSDQVDPVEVGRIWNEKFAKSLNYCVEYRRYNPEVDYLDIAFRETLEKPLDVLAEVYQFCDLEFNESIREGAEYFLGENDRSKRPEHKYSAALFGLSEDQLRVEHQQYRHSYAHYI